MFQLLNYLINIGSSEDIKPETIGDKIVKNFDIKNISTSSAKFSEVSKIIKCRYSKEL